MKWFREAGLGSGIPVLESQVSHLLASQCGSVLNLCELPVPHVKMGQQPYTTCLLCPHFPRSLNDIYGCDRGTNYPNNGKSHYNIYMHQINMLYILNLHKGICQIYFNSFFLTKTIKVGQWHIYIVQLWEQSVRGVHTWEVVQQEGNVAISISCPLYLHCPEPLSLPSPVIHHHTYDTLFCSLFYGL